MQKVVRILRDTSRTQEDRVVKDLSEFCVILQESVYGERYRLEIIESGIKTYEKQVKRAEDGICPLFWPKGYPGRDTKKKERKKKMVKVAWYRPSDMSAVIGPIRDNTYVD